MSHKKRKNSNYGGGISNMSSQNKKGTQTKVPSSEPSSTNGASGKRKKRVIAIWLILLVVVAIIACIFAGCMAHNQEEPTGEPIQSIEIPNGDEDTKTPDERTEGNKPAGNTSKEEQDKKEEATKQETTKPDIEKEGQTAPSVGDKEVGKQPTDTKNNEESKKPVKKPSNKTETPSNNQSTVQPEQPSTEQNDQEQEKPVAIDVTVYIDDKTSIYGDDLEDLTYRIDAEEPVSEEDVRKGISLSKISGKDAGKYEITGKNSNPKYNVTFINGTYTITKREITVSISNQSSYKGDELKGLTYKIIEGSLAKGDKAEKVFELTTNADKNKAGTYLISVTTLSDNYKVTYVTATYKVEVKPTGTGNSQGSSAGGSYGDNEPDKPDNPVDPVDPVNPVDPVDPPDDNPGGNEPTDPVDPVDPVDPPDDNPGGNNPTDPVDPVDPPDDNPGGNNPTDPVDPVDPADPPDDNPGGNNPTN